MNSLKNSMKIFLNGIFALAFLAGSASVMASEYVPRLPGDHAVYQNDRGNQIKVTVDKGTSGKSRYIGGVAYPKPVPGVAVLGEFPDPKVWINRMPGPGPAPKPPAVEVFLTIQNNTAQPLTYSFGSSQRFDILVIDANGRVVSRWSRGHMFAQVMGTLTLAPGEKQRFGGPVSLSYDDGQVLAQGGYTLKIELSSTPAPDTSHTPGSQAPAAIAPLEIGWAY